MASRCWVVVQHGGFWKLFRAQPLSVHLCKANIHHIVDASSSSTFNIVGENEFNISYVDGTGSTGDYFQDAFSIGGATLDAFEMGLATDTTIGVGIMGIGYNTSEANVATGNGTVYANLPQALQNAGKINSNAYSLWLNDLRKFYSSPFVSLSTSTC
jgi:hypothetical protein